MRFDQSSRSMPNSLRSSSPSEVQFRSEQEFLDELNRRWWAEFEEYKAKWDKLNDEQRDRLVKAVLDALLEKVEKDPLTGAQKFVEWLVSPRGVFEWLWIWKPEYRPLIKDITSKAYQLAVMLGMVKP